MSITSNNSLSANDLNLLNTAILFNFKDLSLSSLQESYNYYVTTLNTVVNSILGVKLRKFDNTMMSLETSKSILEPIVNSYEYASNFYPNKEIRDLGSELSNKVKKYNIDLNNNRELYTAIKEYFDKDYTKEKHFLTEEKKSLVEDTMRDYKREGLLLNAEKNQELLEMKKRLAELSTMFDKNINECDTKFELTREQLNGLPESWFTEEKHLGNNLYKVTLKMSDYLPKLLGLVFTEVVTENKWHEEVRLYVVYGRESVIKC